MTAADVIHDIGYRHYDGPRLGREHVWRALYLDALRGAYGLGRTARSKVVPLLCLAAICVPTLIMVAVTAITGADELPVEASAYLLNVQPVIALFVAAQAPATVSRDLRFGVVPLYLSRPLRRTDYVSAKAAAFATAVLVLLMAPATVLLAGALLAELPVGEHLLDWLRALGTAFVLALLLTAVGLVIASRTPRRGIGVAAVVTVLLVLTGVQTVVHTVAVEEGDGDVAGWSRLLSPFSLADGIASRLLGAESPLEPGPAGPALPVALCLVAAALVAAAWWLLVRRYRAVTGS